MTHALPLCSDRSFWVLCVVSTKLTKWTQNGVVAFIRPFLRLSYYCTVIFNKSVNLIKENTIFDACNFVAYGSSMTMNMEKTKIIWISKQPSLENLMIDQKTTGKCGTFKLFGYHYNRRCKMQSTRICEIKSSISVAKAAFNKKTVFTSKTSLLKPTVYEMQQNI
jgi:hypothetical protein